ncbi:MAG: SBBP repeat-containing protein, partial [Candidatus Thorarchaeota archaeon]
FESVVFEELWSGIDLVYRTTSQGAKYEFRVAPGADPSDIRVHCEGQDELIVDDIDITMVKGDNAFKDVGLLVSQDNVKTIQATYLQYDQQTYGVEVGQYDQSDTLIVDPLIFSTFLGGSENDMAFGVNVDSSDNIYICGRAQLGFPTFNAYNDTFGGYTDCFVTKMTAAGTIVFSTYIGGNHEDWGRKIEVGSTGEIYVCGTTFSSDFPTENAYDSTLGDIDIFVVKMASSGDALIYSTFLGGSGVDTVRGIEEDQGVVHIAGYTSSGDFPVTSNALNTTFNGGFRDCFITQLNRDGNDIIYSTFFGGSDTDYCLDLASLPYSSDIWITGYTTSSDFPVSSDLSSGTPLDDNIFVSKFSYSSEEGKVLSYSTLVGGSGHDQGISLDVDTGGSAYVTGTTWSTDFPTTGAFDSSYGGGGEWGGDCFVFKLDYGGSTFSYSTYVGGSDEDFANDIKLDSNNNVLITGYTQSANYPVQDAYDSTFDGIGDLGADCFLTKLAVTGDNLIFSTFIGGSGEESGREVAIDSSGGLILVGWSTSDDFPFLNALDTQVSDMNDVFIMKCSEDMAYPEIASVTRSIQSPTNVDSVQITAVVTDSEGVAAATLQYRTDTQWENVSMVKDVSGANNWTATIPALAIDSIVQYRVMANDSAGNVVVSTLDSYQVVAPPPAIIPTGLIIATVTLVAAILGIIGGVIKLRAAQIDKGIGIGKKDTEAG